MPSSTDPDLPSRLVTTFRADRIVVIEWLPDDPEKTGAILFDRMQRAARFSNRIELRVCQSKSEVLEAIRDARESIVDRGIPIIHIEAHGVCGLHGGFGSATEKLSWIELREPLARLNAASGFNLLVVGASCYGDGILYAVGSQRATAPFIACVGFSTTVAVRSVLEAMTELYRSIFVDRKNIEDAVESAQREVFDKTELLRFVTVRSLIIQSIRSFIEENLNGAIDPAGRIACVHVISGLLAYEQFPNNRERFPIDLNEIYRSYS